MLLEQMLCLRWRLSRGLVEGVTTSYHTRMEESSVCRVRVARS